MSYSLHLKFRKPVKWSRIVEYMEGRRTCSSNKKTIFCNNEGTGVCFSIHNESKKIWPFQDTIRDIEFELNYFRPGYFGIEAEIELSALITVFEPEIEDPQIGGMGQGPYSREGFLNGWNLGNEFAIRAVLSQPPDHKIWSLPQSKLHAVWRWNYSKDDRVARAGEDQFVPRIGLCAIEDRPSLVAVWPIGMSILLPAVDYVLVGQEVAGERRFGLSPWPDVIDIMERAGLDTGRNPLDIRYSRTPDLIEKWAAQIPQIDPQTLFRLSADEVIESETLDAAIRAVS